MADKPKIKNPLIHSHDHDDCDHDHHHSIDVLDPAQQSLSDALRVSFSVLKGIMIVLLIVYCFTGIFRVDKDHVAVRLRFGEIVGSQGGQVYEKGWHFGWPYPIEQIIHIPTTQRPITINEPFWFEVPPNMIGKSLDEMTAPRGGLNPEIDGSLLTGDTNIIHAQFELYYKITDPQLYVTNVGDLEQAEALIRASVEEGIVRTAAQSDTDPLIRGSFNSDFAEDMINKLLTEQGIGIKVSALTMALQTMPLSIRPAYNEVNNAESERASMISEAGSYRTTTLSAAAGEAHAPLFKLIQTYELAQASGDETTAEAVAEVIDRAFDDMQTDGLAIGGETARIINEARTYKIQFVEQIKKEANTFKSYVDSDLYRRSPLVLRERIWQNAKEQIFSGDIETFYANGQMYFELSRDLDVQKDKEKQRIEEAQANPNEQE